MQSVGLKSGLSASTKEYTAEDAKTALRQAAEDVDGELTIEAYDTWQENQPGDYPSDTTIATRLGDGSWVDAKKRFLDSE